MNSQKRPIRFGLSVREAARRWEEAAGTVVSEDDAATVERVDDLTWSWRVGEVEAGRLELRDRGADVGAAELEVNRTDDAAKERITAIVDRLVDLLSEPGLDPPVVARDPHQGDPPEAATDADQPL